MIETARLRLVRWEETHFEAVMNNNLIKLGELLEVETPKEWTTFEDMKEALPFLYNVFKENGNYWGSFFTVHKADKKLLGTCGFKSKPNDSTVEIGYEIAFDYRLKGLAREAAKALIDFAFQHDEVNMVMAHTLAHENPSVSVLKNLGFQFVKELHDTEDGDIWQWLLIKDIKK